MEYVLTGAIIVMIICAGIMLGQLNTIIEKLNSMSEIIIKVINKCHKKKKKKKFKWHVKEVSHFNNLKTKGTILMTSVKVDQNFTATWGNPKDRHGNDAVVQDGSVSFVSDDDSIASVEPNPDGGPYSAKITSHGKTGATAIRIKADANLNDDGDPTTGDDVKEIEGLLSVEVLAGEATTFGEPTIGEVSDNPPA